ncbi:MULTISPECIES: ArsR/SmtB family transcription factor [Streptomyces]|uniref:Helix-turn-helix transcriptional regulator n=1 Tax=Streptomyces poriferorum TaxID=2798799 RepID=A0ABY9IFN7_9ACTN|nr:MULTISPECIES: helix-turn-helix transcriptional regulator [unclassified Streptomyces]MDP5315639.1 helix-turn-helix transcriptional regulator [Streptomyces sp. Alt4]WLQ54008.1 helix-turn-helix transcriptional regulator [Streptomyces sp. Alt2]WSI60657.1 ArsR family transcriptional regulator [Streptomyces sp. NBC_01336]
MTVRTDTERITDHPDANAITLQGVLEALVDPVRRSIVRQLAQNSGDMACGTFDISVSRSTGTHHFKVLRHAGVIRQYYVGTSRMNELRADDLAERFPGLLMAVVGASSATES